MQICFIFLQSISGLFFNQILFTVLFPLAFAKGKTRTQKMLSVTANSIVRDRREKAQRIVEKISDLSLSIQLKTKLYPRHLIWTSKEDFPQEPNDSSILDSSFKFCKFSCWLFLTLSYKFMFCLIRKCSCENLFSQSQMKNKKLIECITK